MVNVKMLSVLVANFIVTSAFAGVLELGPVKKTVDGFQMVKNAQAQGRHGSYTLKDQASANIEVKGGGLKVLTGQILIQRPKDFGGKLDKLVRLVFRAKAPAIRLKLAVDLPASLATAELEKIKDHPELQTPKKEVEQLIAVLKPMGETLIKDLTVFVETSSMTIYFEINEQVSEIESSEEFFTLIKKLWKQFGSQAEEHIRVIYL